MINVVNFLTRGFGMEIKAKVKLLRFYQHIADSLRMPVELVVAHAHQESHQRITAVGALKEYGLWQFMPYVWENLMGSADWRSVANQTEAYIKHTKWIIDRYKLNLNSYWDKVVFLWIWNAGAGNYEKGRMPKTTKDYIRRILKYEGFIRL